MDSLVVFSPSPAASAQPEAAADVNLVITFKVFREAGPDHVELTFDSGHCVAYLKARLQELLKTPMEQQKLVFNGKQLDDYIYVAAYGIKTGSAVHMFVAGLKGAGPGRVIKVDKKTKKLQHNASRLQASRAAQMSPSSCPAVHSANTFLVGLNAAIDTDRDLFKEYVDQMSVQNIEAINAIMFPEGWRTGGQGGTEKKLEKLVPLIFGSVVTSLEETIAQCENFREALKTTFISAYTNKFLKENGNYDNGVFEDMLKLRKLRLEAVADAQAQHARALADAQAQHARALMDAAGGDATMG